MYLFYFGTSAVPAAGYLLTFPSAGPKNSAPVVPGLGFGAVDGVDSTPWSPTGVPAPRKQRRGSETYV